MQESVNGNFKFENIEEIFTLGDDLLLPDQSAKAETIGGYNERISTHCGSVTFLTTSAVRFIQAAKETLEKARENIYDGHIF